MLENMNNIVNDILFIQKMDLSHIISKEYPIQILIHKMYINKDRMVADNKLFSYHFFKFIYFF